ncbi:hypothetical protein HY29_09905 [Hyphomonas beringensis]|uniref:Uncharacterized protein n=1 Tax=Hyphomonas beringensis TaxID=1280946 RepID=A0A062UIF0_9PROT|nr:hypothetical protein [Hyphomonas beringensis]KCZ55910.1 hypothetical protein HY29_09905 [Hyphomonas beringensis]
MVKFTYREDGPVTGFVYVANSKRDDRFRTARPGDIIRNPEPEPPYIVVSHNTDDIILSDWPGTLWTAEVIDANAPQEDEGDFTRATAVRLVERLPAHTLFGPNGEAVAWVADRASGLTYQEADLLAEHRAPGAASAYAKAWLNWEGLTPSSREYTEWEGIISIGSEGPFSPVGRGLRTVFGAVVAQAWRIQGDDAMYAEGGPEEDPDLHLVEPWASAALCLVEITMALGAPGLLNAEDRKLLTDPWRTLTSPSLS